MNIMLDCHNFVAVDLFFENDREAGIKPRGAKALLEALAGFGFKQKFESESTNKINTYFI